MKYLKVFESDIIRADKAKSIVPIYKFLKKYIDDLIKECELTKIEINVTLSDWNNPHEPFDEDGFPDNFNIQNMLNQINDDELVSEKVSIEDLYIFFDMKISIYTPVHSKTDREDLTYALKNKIKTSERYLKFCTKLQDRGFSMGGMEVVNDQFGTGQLTILIGYGLKNHFNEVGKIFKEL